APLFAKEAYILWRGEYQKKLDMLPGKRGKPVADFKAQLRSLGRIGAANTTDTYDAETATAVSRIQSETGLLMDGVSGQQVRMVLKGGGGGAVGPGGGGWGGTRAAPRRRTGRRGGDANPARERASAPAEAPKPAPVPQTDGPATPPAAEAPDENPLPNLSQPPA